MQPAPHSPARGAGVAPGDKPRLGDAAAPVNGRIATLAVLRAALKPRRVRPLLQMNMGRQEREAMGKLISVLALLAGLGMAVALHSGHSTAATAAAVPERPMATGGMAAPIAWTAPSSARPPQPWQDGTGPSRQPVGMFAAAAPAALPAPQPDVAPETAVADASLANDFSRDLRFAFAPVPEPQSWALLITGMLMVGGRLRRRASSGRTYLATL